MSRIAEILVRARDTLADPDKERWSDDRLLRLLDEGQKVVALQARVLRERVNLLPNYNQAIYDLPDDCQLYTRVLPFLGEDLPFVHHDRADKQYKPSWEYHFGPDIISVVYDKNDTQQLKLYPKLQAPCRLPSPDSPAAPIFENVPEAPGESVDVTIPTYGLVTYLLGHKIVHTYGLMGTVQDSELQPVFGVMSAYPLNFEVQALVANTLPFGFTMSIEGYTFDSLWGLMADMTDSALDVNFTNGYFDDPETPDDDYLVSVDGFYGIYTSWEDYINDYNLWGVVVAMTDSETVCGQTDFDIETIWGVTVGLYNEGDEYDIEDIWGVTATVTGNINAPEELVVYYQKQPAEITNELDQLEVDPCFDAALKFYITGMALRDDKDTQNRAIGSDELKLFSIGLQEAIKNGTMNGTASNTQYRPQYTSGFDKL